MFREKFIMPTTVETDPEIISRQEWPKIKSRLGSVCLDKISTDQPADQTQFRAMIEEVGGRLHKSTDHQTRFDLTLARRPELAEKEESFNLHARYPQLDYHLTYQTSLGPLTITTLKEPDHNYDRRRRIIWNLIREK